MSADQMPVNQVSGDQVVCTTRPVDQIYIDQMSVGLMVFGQKTWSQKKKLIHSENNQHFFNIFKVSIFKGSTAQKVRGLYYKTFYSVNQYLSTVTLPNTSTLVLYL